MKQRVCACRAAVVAELIQRLHSLLERLRVAADACHGDRERLRRVLGVEKLLARVAAAAAQGGYRDARTHLETYDGSGCAGNASKRPATLTALLP